MAAVRLEELLRVLGIAALSAFAGTAAFITPLLTGTPIDADPATGLFMFVFLGSIAWFYTFVSSLLCGITLHFALRGWQLPRLLLLPMFVAVAVLVAFTFFSNVPDRVPIAMAAAAAGWLAYCYGPLALWRYRFDESSDVDF